MVGENAKKEDEKKEIEEMHQQKVTQMIKSAEGSAGLLHKITSPTAWREGAQILKKEEEGWTVVMQRGKSGQSISSVMGANFGGHALENEELKKSEEALQRLKECDLEKASRLYKAKTGVGCDGFHTKIPGPDERNKKRNCGVTGKRWNKVENGRSKVAQRCCI